MLGMQEGDGKVARKLLRVDVVRDDGETERRRWRGLPARCSGLRKRERMEKSWLGSFGGMWRC
jgi:hypothetical protein